MLNKQVLLASRPAGTVTPDNFRIAEAPLPEPGEGEVLVKNEWLSLDPYMRGRMNDAKSYAPSVDVGALMVGQTVGEVVESRHPGFRRGDKVLTSLGWQLFGVAKGKELMLVDASRVPASYYLGVLGMPGITAWFGLFEIGKPKPGDTVVVSAASGAVGSVVGQLAKQEGCRVVGIAGGRAKCDYVVRELGFDACVDYKAGRLLEDLRAACPKGIDVDFENVGGEVLDTVLRAMNPFSRIVVCGLIAEYDATEPYGYRMLRAVLVNRIRMQGMIVFDWKDRYGEALADLSARIAAGKLRYKESIVEGLENAPRGLMALLSGGNFGKQLVKLG
ncbi:MAG TPA: NADP-dependent oxidoreductase [Usitatibacter sp.]|jgi:NADPH-dependent curcumin reductase CurA|nr:NADP-dependent oxidoreductase [Usitatibacter sp.]